MRMLKLSPNRPLENVNVIPSELCVSSIVGEGFQTALITPRVSVIFIPSERAREFKLPYTSHINVDKKTRPFFGTVLFAAFDDWMNPCDLSPSDIVQVMKKLVNYDGVLLK